MRSKQILINTFYSLLSAVIMALLSLITRRFFLQYFGVALLGYESLFSNVFSLLALSDLGIGTVITYALYQEVANDNKEEITLLMNLYKRFYQIVGVFIIIIGIIIYFFIPYIVEGDSYQWEYVYFVYVMQLISTLCTYFLAYRRILFTVNQKTYICVNIETIVNLISGIVKIIAIILFRNLFIYFLAGILNNLLSNLIISIKFRSDYKYACEKRILTKNYLKKRHFWGDLKNNLACRISETIYSSTDSILISIFINIEQVGRYTNYMIIDNYVTGILIKLLKPIQAAIGNYVYVETKEDNQNMLSMLNLLSFFMASFIACGYCVMMQIVIRVWLGKQYQLPMLFVIFLSINCYIRWNYYFTYMYRNTWGNFEQDRNFYVMSAFFNFIISIVFQHFWGIAGIMFGTLVGQLLFWIGRSKVVFHKILETTALLYAKQQVLRAFLFGLELAICNLMINIGGIYKDMFLYKIFICIFIPNLFNLILFKNTTEFKQLICYLGKIAGSLILNKNIIKNQENR